MSISHKRLIKSKAPVVFNWGFLCDSRDKRQCVHLTFLGIIHLSANNNLVATFGGHTGINDLINAHMQFKNNSDAWVIFLVWLREKSSRATAYYFEQRILYNSFKNTKPTVDAVIELLEILQPVEDLNRFAQQLKPHLLNSTTMMPLYVLKFNDGVLANKIQLISEYLYLAYAAYELSLPLHYAKNSQVDVGSFKSKLNALLNDLPERQLIVEPFFTITKYANGNINVKVANAEYLNLFYGEDYFIR